MNAQKVFKACGRLAFVILMALQTFFLSMYLVKYSSINGISWVGLLVLPALILWSRILGILGEPCDENQLSKLWSVWFFYVVELIVFFGIIFGTDVREKLDKKNVFGPNVLKTTICITPAIALLLITTASDSQKYGDLVNQLCGNIVLDLFDTIEALAIVIAPEDPTSHLDKSLIISIVVIVGIALLLSPLEMAENKFLPRGETKIRKKLYFWRLLLEMLLVNIALMIVRLIAWLKFKHEASIFIAKNAIIVVVSITNIMKFQKCCGLGDN
ncbi:uncharacterized protein LOC114576202 [Exaiptasia diaphana]|uniref:Uncharacterized protein n=1 Tax=Exaiptasia diaphana TaxID=2652724 RepID=A0A913YSQ9_EXADI|nr:uncharacterized protein LOC114576202 [Exaiptasia diaphana]